MKESTARSHPPDSIRQAFLWVMLPAFILFLIAPSVGDAQVATTSITSTTGAGDLGTAVTQSGTQTGYLYDITGGTRPGNGPTLFHSFGDFTVGGGDIANFLNETAVPTTNILGRITGGDISTIDGTIQTTGFDTANLFLINPSGIVLGPTASVTVGGSVSLSTANYLRFEGTATLFDMLSTPASLGQLSVAPVVAFGFLGPELPAPITVQGSMLQVPEGQSLSLVGGDITAQAASLRAPGGHINLVSVASPGEVLVPSLQTGLFSSMGTVTLNEGAMLDVSGQFDEFGTPIGNGNSGTVFVRGGQLVMEASAILANTVGVVDGASSAVDIQVSQNVALTNGAAIDSSTFDTGRAGALTITTQTLALANFAKIAADTFGAAPAGNITLNVGSLTAGSDTGIFSTSSLQDSTAGKAGDITIQGITGSGSPAATVSLDESTITTEISGGSAATTPGAITITAHTLALGNRVGITASTVGAAPAGDITLNVETLTASYSPAGFGSTGIFSGSHSNDSTAGHAGNITIQGITGSGSPATNVRLDSADINTVSVGGSAANTPATITITARTLALANGATIGASTVGTAPAGDITLSVDTLTTSSPAGFRFSEIFSGSNSGDSTAGHAGNITIQGVDGAGSPAANVRLDNSTISTTIAAGTSSSIPATIDITAQTVNLANGAQIKADTSGAAPAGNIALNVDTLTAGILTEISSTSIPTDSTAGNAGSITIQGITGPGSSATNVSLKGNTSFGNEFCCKLISTTIAGGTSSTTPATIDITAQTVNLANGAQISAETDGAAPAGDITLNVGTLTAGNFSVISSGSGRGGDPAAGSAGNITIQGINGSSSPAANMSLLDFSEIRSETFGGSAANTAANIDITAQTLALAHGTIRADSEGAAPAGNITFNVGKLTVDSSSISSSSFDFSLDSTAGNAGSITIQGVTGAGSPAANVSLLPFTGINTLTGGGSTANTPATITITAQKLTLANAVIAADTFGAAPAGNIAFNVGTLTANLSVIESGSSPFEFSLDSTVGNAGNITVQGITGSGNPAANVSLDGSEISTRANGGSADTAPATITITAHTLALANFAKIAADTFGAAPAGNIALNVGSLTSSGSPGGFTLFGITSNSSSFPDITAGNAGSITIQGITGAGSPAAHVSLDDSNISTVSFGGSAATAPANITITAHTLALANGAVIQASTSGNAPAGNIELVTQQLTMTPDSAITSNAQTGGTGTAGSITITGVGSAPTTIAGGTIQAQSETSAIAGDITLQAPGDLTILGTTVSVKNTGSGNAGSIGLLAGNDLFVRNSQVSTDSADASGGNIKLTAPNLVRVVDSTLTSSVHGQAGSNGGNINIDPQLVVIQNSQLLANANAGAGGNITIAATGAVLVDPNSRIDASAGPAGISGSVNINSPIQVLGGILVPLNQAYSQAGLSGDRCAADPTGQFSSFVQTGRDGVPQVPGALSPSPLSFLETLTSTSLGSPLPNWAAARLGLDSLRVDDSTRFQFHSACRS